MIMKYDNDDDRINVCHCIFIHVGKLSTQEAHLPTGSTDTIFTITCGLAWRGIRWWFNKYAVGLDATPCQI